MCALSLASIESDGRVHNGKRRRWRRYLDTYARVLCTPAHRSWATSTKQSIRITHFLFLDVPTILSIYGFDWYITIEPIVDFRTLHCIRSIFFISILLFSLHLPSRFSEITSFCSLYLWCSLPDPSLFLCVRDFFLQFPSAFFWSKFPIHRALAFILASARMKLFLRCGRSSHRHVPFVRLLLNNKSKKPFVSVTILNCELNGVCMDGCSTHNDCAGSATQHNRRFCYLFFRFHLPFLTGILCRRRTASEKY